MNPGQLFDYLDGNLSPSERAELEARLVSDRELQRELAVAREIHSGIRHTRTALDQLESTPAAGRGAVLGRRIAIIFGVLVFVNVLFGIYAIAFMDRRRSAPNEQNRQQLNQALQNAAAAALPTPKLDVDEIKVPAANPQRDAVASKIIAAATECGGSAAKNLNDENGLLVFAEIPAAQENKFREKLSALGAPETKAEPNPSNASRIIQIRVVDQTKH
jgi:anti-sigma factor RsiW